MLEILKILAVVIAVVGDWPMPTCFGKDHD